MTPREWLQGDRAEVNAHLRDAVAAAYRVAFPLRPAPKVSIKRVGANVHAQAGEDDGNHVFLWTQTHTVQGDVFCVMVQGGTASTIRSAAWPCIALRDAVQAHRHRTSIARDFEAREELHAHIDARMQELARRAFAEIFGRPPEECEACDDGSANAHDDEGNRVDVDVWNPTWYIAWVRGVDRYGRHLPRQGTPGHATPEDAIEALIEACRAL